VLEKQHFKSGPSTTKCYFSSIHGCVAAEGVHAALEMSDAETVLARREREVMSILFRRGEATAKDIQDELVEPPTYSAVRALLATMAGKGLVKTRKDSRRYVYRASTPEKKAKQSALRHLLSTFFEGRPEKLVASLLDPKDQALSRDEIRRIKDLITTGDDK
jgi:BlaI family transcriptional regulator, penicillinase repressor